MGDDPAPARRRRDRFGDGQGLEVDQDARRGATDEPVDVLEIDHQR